MKKMKAVGIAAAVVAVLLAIALVGLSVARSKETHVHEYTKWAYDDAQHWKVCEADGAESEHEDHAFDADNDYICECGAQHIHTYEWKYDDDYHWKECPDGYKTRKKRHSFNDNGVCECGDTTIMTEVHGVLKMYNCGALVKDYKDVTFALAEAESGEAMNFHSRLNSEDGTYSFKVPQSKRAYILTISKDNYVSDSIAFDGTKEKIRDAKLFYIAYVPTPGMENWGIIDYSQLGRNIIRLDNDMQFLFSKRTYNKIAFSVVLQPDWNSAGKNGRQGVIFRFVNGKGYAGVAPVQTFKDSFLRSDDERYNTWGWDPAIGGPLALAEGYSGDVFVDFENRPDLKADLNEGRLKLTVLRDGSVLYVFLNDEFVGFKKYDDKYENMRCEVGFYYYDFKGSTIRDWNFQLIGDTSALEEKIPTGTLNAAIKIRDKEDGKISQLADGEKVTIEKIGGGLTSGEFAVTDGKITIPSLLAGTYRLTYGEDYYATITIEPDEEYTDDVILQYKRFDLLMGWEEEKHDFSHIYDEKPTIGNNEGTLNVITRDTYDDVAASFWLKKDNSVSSQKVQGILIKFSNGKYMVTRLQYYEGKYKLQWAADMWDLPMAKAEWRDYQSPLTDEQMTALGSEEGMKLTLIRSGNALAISIDDKVVPAGAVTLGEEYASMTAQVGFFAWESNEDATWRFDIETEISDYTKKIFVPTPGMEGWGLIDYTQQDNNIIRLDNDMQFLFSWNTYKKVGFSIVLQGDWDSAGKTGRQGISFRFKNSDGYQGMAPIQTVGEDYLRSDDEPYNTWGWDSAIGTPLTLADGWGGEWLLNFADRPDLKDALNAGTLKLTVLRDGSVFYAFLNDEYVGFKKYDDKYADMESEVGFYYYDFKGSTERDWKFELIEDTAALEAKIPNGSLNAAIKLKAKEDGTVTKLADGEKVTIERIGGGLTSGEFTVTDGKITIDPLLAGTYRFTYGEDYYALVKIKSGSKLTEDIVLQYKRFDMLMGWGEDDHDFSHVNDENPTIGNDGGTLNVISRDTYHDVAASLWLKEGNSVSSENVQGIVIKFSNGCYMLTRIQLYEGNYKLQWVENLWDLPIAKPEWHDYQSPLTDAQLAAFKSAEGLKLTLVRSGNTLSICLNDEKIPAGELTLDEEYASMTAQVGFFDWDSSANATWRFDIESDITDYTHEHEYTKWAYNDTQHWKVCERDGAEGEHADHVFKAENDYVCECGKKQDTTKINGTLKIFNRGKAETDYSGVVFTLTDVESGNASEIQVTVNGNGAYSFGVPTGEKEYTLTISKDGYTSASISFKATQQNIGAAKLVYIAYVPTSGMEDWGKVDYSQLDNNIITLNNDMQFIFSKDTYKNIAFSVTLQADWNSAGEGRQGISFRFKNGNGYQGMAPIQTVGEQYLRSDDEHYDTWGLEESIRKNLALADGCGGEWLVNFADRQDLKDALNAGTLKLTVLRDGSVFYAFLNDEYVGFKKYDDKYADMESEVGFYYYGFQGSTDRDWHIELIEDTAALKAKIPNGALDATIRLKDKQSGNVAPLADGAKVTIERIGGGLTSGEFAVTDGKITIDPLLAGTYRFTYGEDYYALVKIESGSKLTEDIVLQYKRFDMLMGWGEDDHDFSHVNDENPTIGNDGGTLNVISRDSYDDVAASLWIKKENSIHAENTQGIVVKFDNGNYMVARCQFYNGEFKLQWMGDLWGLPLAKAEWKDFQTPLTDAQLAAFESEDGLKFTIVRSGKTLTAYYYDGTKDKDIPASTVTLDDEYAGMKVQVGFFNWDSCANAVWKFNIESNTSGYQHTHEFTKWGYDDTQHWQICEADNAESEHVDHNFAPENDYVCECGKKLETTKIYGTLKVSNRGKAETDYSGVVFTLTDVESGNASEIPVAMNGDGSYSFAVPTGEKEYTLTISKDGYTSASISFKATQQNIGTAKLVYITYVPTPDMEGWGKVDYSQLDNNIITLDNDMQFLFSKDTYRKVAFSVVLQKDWNSAGQEGRQGVSFRFKNGDGYQGMAPIQTVGEAYLRSDDEHYETWGWPDERRLPLTLADGCGGEWLVNFADRQDLKDALNAGTLKLTVLRDGSVFYAFLNDEYVGFKKYDDKYADMECEVGFYYYNFAGSTDRAWNIELIENTAALEAKIPNGALDATIQLKDKQSGNVAPLADGEKVTIERIGGGLTSGEFAVTGGKITIDPLLAGTYRFTYGEDYYALVKIKSGSKLTEDIVLQYKRFDMLMGWGEDDHDFSHVNDENPTIGNDGGTLNVISRDFYDDVAASLWIKKENSIHAENTQGVVVKFDNGNYMVARCQFYNGEFKLQWMGDLWGLPLAKAEWKDFQTPLTDAQLAAFESEDGLKFTIVRSGKTLTAYYYDGTKDKDIPASTVTLDDEYAGMKVQVGFFNWDSCANAVWKFNIESNTSGYQHTHEFTKWGYDDTQHWQICEVDNAESEHVDHSFTAENNYTCECGKVLSMSSVAGTLKIWKNGAVETDYTGITFALTETESGEAVEISVNLDTDNGSYSFKMPKSGKQYTLTISKDGYMSASVAVDPAEDCGLGETKLLYKRFDVIGSDQKHDFTHVNDAEPTIGNNGGQLRVISRDTYDDVAASLWLKAGNCIMGENKGDTQGVLMRFANGQYVAARVQKDGDGFKMQWLGTINWLGDGFDGTSTAYGDGYWTNIVDSLNDAQMAAFNGDEGLKLTVVRSGNVLLTYVNGEKFDAGTVTLGEEYASMTAQVGFFAYQATENAVWKFDIELDVSSYTHVHEYTKWVYDDTQHWQICEADNAESEHVDHSFTAENDYTCECGKALSMSSVAGTLKIWKNGTVETDYTGVTFALTETESGEAQEISVNLDTDNGSYSFKVPKSEKQYTLTISKDGYVSASATINPTADCGLGETKLLYKRFDVIGSDQKHDFTHVNDAEPTIGNNGGQMRVISRDTYDDVAASLWLKAGNCIMGENKGDTQGVLMKFANGQYVAARVQKDGDGFKMQWLGTINWLGDGFAGTSTAYGDGYWTNIVDSLNDAQMAAFNGDEGLKLTIVRSGNALLTYVNGEKFDAGTVTLGEEYASMTAQVGFFAYQATENAVWKFDIESDVSSYTHVHEYTEWKYDEEQHWQICKADNAESEHANHAFTPENGYVCECGKALPTREVTGTLKLRKNGGFDNYTGVVFTITDGNNTSPIKVELNANGSYSLKVLTGDKNYKLEISKSGYTSASLEIKSTDTDMGETTLMYERFNVIGNDQKHDFTHVNDAEPTIGNNGGQLRVISRDTYDDVAASLWLKAGNCIMGENEGDTQGVLMKFANGQYVAARVQKDGDGFKMQWLGTINWLGDGFNGTSTAYGDGYWTNIVDSLNDAQMAAFNGDEGLKLTVVRSGNVLLTYVNGEKFDAGTVTLGEEYASMTAQVGFFAYQATENAVWKFDIESNISAYNLSVEAMPADSTEKPVETPTENPTETPAETPTETPTEKPVEAPTETPTEKPTEASTEKPTEKSTDTPTEKPVKTPTEAPVEETGDDGAAQS